MDTVMLRVALEVPVSALETAMHERGIAPTRANMDRFCRSLRKNLRIQTDGDILLGDYPRDRTTLVLEGFTFAE